MAAARYRNGDPRRQARRGSRAFVPATARRHNGTHAQIRCLGEQIMAILMGRRLLRKLRCSTNRITAIVQAVLALHHASALRQDRVRRRRKIGLWAGAGVFLASGFALWLFDVTAGERLANEPFAPGLLEEALWPDTWPLTTGLPFRGSPAAGWDRTDVASSMLPPALVRPVGGLSADQVTTGLDTVRDFVRVANVSDEVLTGERAP